MERKGRVGFEDTDSRVFIPLTTAQDISGFKGIHGLVANYRESVSEQRAIAAVWRQLGTLVSGQRSPTRPFSVMSGEGRREGDGTKTMSIFRTVLAGISSIAMLVAGIGIMNVMLIRVLAAAQGDRRAPRRGGETVRDDRQPVPLREQRVSSGWRAAWPGLGIGGVAAYCRYAEWEFYISPWTLVEGASFSIGVGLLFGVIPAVRATSVDPISTLRSEV